MVPGDVGDVLVGPDDDFQAIVEGTLRDSFGARQLRQRGAGDAEQANQAGRGEAADDARP